MRLDITRSLFRATNALGALALGAAGSWVLYSHFGIDHNVPLPEAVAAERNCFTSPDAGGVSYYVDRQASGRPLVLLHSINAAPSVMEMKPLFERYRTSRPVYAFDLPGFGFSERPQRKYTPEFYAETIRILMREVVGEPADVVAFSLTSEFAAMAALEAPDLFRSLVFISPTGLSEFDVPEPRDSVYRVVSFPIWSQALYDLLVIRPSIRFFLGKSFEGETPEELIDYAYATSHQPGARHAPISFVSGQLFTPKVRQHVYAKLPVHTLVLYGVDPNVGFERIDDILQANNLWQAVHIPAVNMPHWERPKETTAALGAFWADFD